MEEKQLGRGDKLESKAFKELLEEHFFSLSLDIFEERGGEVKFKPYEEPFHLKLGHFPRKGGGLNKIQTF